MNRNNCRVGIGTTSPGYLLHVNGSAGKPGGGSWSNASDLRLKKNVAPLEGALARLLSVRGAELEARVASQAAALEAALERFAALEAR